MKKKEIEIIKKCVNKILTSIESNENVFENYEKIFWLDENTIDKIINDENIFYYLMNNNY